MLWMLSPDAYGNWELLKNKFKKAYVASVYRRQHASTHVISRVFSVIFNRRTSLYASFIFLENP